MTSSPEHARLLRLATRASVAVACTLIIAKAIAWWLSGSVSMLAGLTDSALDGVTSSVGIVAQGEDEDDQEIEVKLGPSKIGNRIVGVVGSIIKV